MFFFTTITRFILPCEGPTTKSTLSDLPYVTWQQLVEWTESLLSTSTHVLTCPYKRLLWICYWFIKSFIYSSHWTCVKAHKKAQSCVFGINYLFPTRKCATYTYKMLSVQLPTIPILFHSPTHILWTALFPINLSQMYETIASKTMSLILHLHL